MRVSSGLCKRLTIALGFLIVLCSGCVYRLDIQQGNHLDEATVAQVTEGMTRKQVRFLLGTPMIEDPFHAERWDYVYYLKKGRTREVETRHFIVHFTGDTVARLERVSGYE